MPTVTVTVRVRLSVSVSNPGHRAQALEATGGTMPEFVNPKYANEEQP